MIKKKVVITQTKLDLMIPVPLSLLKILMAEPEDVKKGGPSYEEIREVGKSMANLLITMEENK